MSGLISRLRGPDGCALLVIAAAVIVAQLLYVLGVFSPDPLGTQSGLGTVTSGGVLPGLPTIDPNVGVVSQALGHRAWLDLLGLHIPWWNPYEGTGAPLAGEMQSASLFPLTVLTLLANGQVYEHLLLELVAGGSTYLLLRRLDIWRVPATGAAIAFALGGTFAWLAHAPVNPIAFAPMVLLGIELAYAATMASRRGGWWLIAVAGAFSIYAGFPETAYIDGLLAVVWFAWRCGCAGSGGWARLLGKGVAGAAVAGLLAAPLLVAFVDYTAHGDLGVHGGAIAGSHLPSAALPQLLIPYVYGPIFAFSDRAGTLDSIWGQVGGYLTASLVLFALVGLLTPGRRWLRGLLCGWIVLVVARIYGEPPLLGHVLGVLPGMSRVAFLRYADPALALAVVVLAAVGLDGVARGSVPRLRLGLAAVVALGMVLAATVGAVSLEHAIVAAPDHRTYSRASVAVAAAVLVAGTTAAFLPRARLRGLAVATLVALEALGMFVVPELSAPRAVTIDTAPPTYLARHLHLSRFFTLGSLQPNYGTYYGLRSLNADDVPLPTRFAALVNARIDPAVNPLIFNGTPPGRPPGAPTPEQELITNLAGYRAAGVADVLSPAGSPLPAGHGLRLVFKSSTTWIYHLSGAQPYFTAAGCRTVARSGTSLTASCSRPATLIRRETYMPGWSATVDGHTTAVHPWGIDFQAVPLRAGVHRISFDFEPPHLAPAIVAWCAGWLWLLLASIRTPAWRRRRPVAALAPARPGGAAAGAGAGQTA